MEIYRIPIGDRLGTDIEDYQIIYAPLIGKIKIVDRDFSFRPDIIPELFEESNRGIIPSGVRQSCELTKMAVLPNHTCNFNCSYCYSAQGRSKVTLDEGKLDRALEYFLNPQRVHKKTLNLTFIGGGEPLLSWRLVKHGIEYAHRLALQHGFHLQTTLTSNGSIMNEDIISTLQDYQVYPNISFDILEEAQNKHRRHFEQVCHTLDVLCQHNCIPLVIATITPDTVHRLEEMFDFIDWRFPKISAMSFEPVISSAVFETAASLGAFYDTFLQHFFRARKRAKEKGKSITCRIFRNVSSIQDRGCPSKLTLTPQGDLSICYCISSPKETNYAERVFGNVDEKGVMIDEDRFQRINGLNVYSFEKCEDCFAKWHCAGGCTCANDRYDEAHLSEVCRYTKEMVRLALIERMEEKCQHKGIESLASHCRSQHIVEL